MALQIIGSNSIGVGIRANLGTVDDLFIGENATVGSTDGSTAIVGPGDSHNVDIQGTVIGQTQVIELGDSLGDYGQTLLVGENAYVAGVAYTGQAAVAVLGNGSLIDNRGTIHGYLNALYVGGDDAQSTTTINNSGLIEGPNAAISRSGINTGVLNNTGEIRTNGTPSQHSYYGFSTGQSQVTNSGLMIGGIQLGWVDDLYDGRAGKIVGIVEGYTGADTLLGGAFAETFKGGSGNDVLNGGGGNDVLDGGAGADLMIGGTGNDLFKVDDLGDVVNESGGNGLDLVQSTLSFNLASPARSIGAVENLTLVNVATALSGSGNAYNNVISGNTFANILNGLGGNDTLIGGNGNDKLNGGLGIDTMTGGANSDIFIFNTAPNAATNRDFITDFNHNDDTMQLENAIFTKLGAGVHALNPAFFRVGAAAADANDYIVYNKATGALFYDVNGNGAGGAVMFAVLSTRPGIAANDFVVI